jgi:hypothetical protein
MNLLQIRLEKKKLEERIQAAIKGHLKTFQGETGVNVEDINVEFIETTYIGQGRKSVLSEVNVKLEDI